MAVKVGINGFGRIGRNVFRAAHAAGADLEFVAVNDLTDPATLAHLLKYDSVLGRFPGEVEAATARSSSTASELKVLSERDPADLPWGDLGVEVVIESTGFFTARDDAAKHLDGRRQEGDHLGAGQGPRRHGRARRQLDDAYDRDSHDIISNASCTTNCLAPAGQGAARAFGIEQGLMTTIHAYTDDQRLQDMPHKDLRRARAAALNLIPTTTGAAKAVGLVLPELNGKLNGFVGAGPGADRLGRRPGLRRLAAEPSADEINAAVKAAAEGPLKGILAYTEDPIVSTDIVGDPHSSIFDAGLTMVIGDGTMVKVVAWYDNEWGYSNRCVELAGKVL